MDRGTERCCAEAAKHLRELYPPPLRCPDQYCECSDCFEVHFSRLQNALAIIDQDVSLLLNRECNGLTFSMIERGWSGRRDRPKAYDIQPGWWMTRP